MRWNYIKKDLHLIHFTEGSCVVQEHLAFLWERVFCLRYFGMTLMRIGTLVKMTKKKLYFYKHGFMEGVIILCDLCCCFSKWRKKIDNLEL